MLVQLYCQRGCMDLIHHDFVYQWADFVYPLPRVHGVGVWVYPAASSCIQGWEEIISTGMRFYQFINPEFIEVGPPQQTAKNCSFLFYNKTISYCSESESALMLAWGTAESHSWRTKNIWKSEMLLEKFSFILCVGGVMVLNVAVVSLKVVASTSNS